MPLDGVFIHHLVNELNNELINYKINKIYQPSPLEIVLLSRGKDNKDGNSNTKQLYISCSLDQPRIFINDNKYTNLDNPLNFCMLLRKYIDRGIIKAIQQIENDRIIEIIIESISDLGDNEYYHLIFELMGRNSNVILTNNNLIIIDSIRRAVPSETNSRIILPKASYYYPIQENMINPFSCDLISSSDYQKLQGCSKILQNELKEQGIVDVPSFITKQIIPTYYQYEKKYDFYFMELSTIPTPLKTITFDSFSKMFIYESNLKNNISNYQISELMKHLKKVLISKNTKINNLQSDLDKAKENIKYTNIGILVQSNLYKIKQGDTSIEVDDFLHNYEKTFISLNPLLSPSDNLKRLFIKGKKAQTALIEVDKQLNETIKEVKYLTLINDQLSFANLNDYEDIRQELTNNNYLKIKKNGSHNKKHKISLQKICLEDTTITIGKNNIQNEYLIHKVARNNDWWFHIKDAPGAHIVISSPNNSDVYEPNEILIRTASNIAACLSKQRMSSSVPIDYTRIKYLKKIPGEKGYNVTYTNQKTIYIDPDLSLLKENNIII